MKNENGKIIRVEFTNDIAATVDSNSDRTDYVLIVDEDLLFDK